jgi:hypothetical protein
MPKFYIQWAITGAMELEASSEAEAEIKFGHLFSVRDHAETGELEVLVIDEVKRELSDGQAAALGSVERA